VTKRVLGSGQFVYLVEDESWEYVERIGISGIVAIVPITPEGEIVMIEQYRPPVRATVIELPAGLAGDLPGHENEPLVEAAKRELLEETGYRASGWRHLIDGPPSPGICSEVISWFMATGLERVGTGGGDASEKIRDHRVPLSEALSWLEDRQQAGLMVDPKVFLGLYYAQREVG